jgi:hypothetical protein
MKTVKDAAATILEHLTRSNHIRYTKLLRKYKISFGNLFIVIQGHSKCVNLILQVSFEVRLDVHR